MVFYVVHKGVVPGIYNSWEQCKKQVDKFEGAIFKKFTNKEEATIFLKDGFGINKKPRIITRRENDDKKNNNLINNETDDDGTEKIFIYTDGSCIKFKNNISKAGYGIYIPSKNIKVSKPLLNQKITNNRAELTAIIESVEYLDEDDLIKKICIFTDSQYSIYIFTGTGERYAKDGYKKDGVEVPNVDLIKKILEIKKRYNIILLKVRSHTDKKDEHSIGNKIADKLANDGALFIGNSSKEIFKKKSFDETSEDEESFDELSTNKKFVKESIFKNSIKHNITMNELFEFEESSSEIIKTNKPLKNPKLSKWFLQKS